MPNDNHTLELNQKDLDLIEAALHTQQKILSVQSEAGGMGAQERLSALKHLMKRLSRQKSAARSDTAIVNAMPAGQAAADNPPCQGFGVIARNIFC
ncbi:hypothetical protein R5H30_16435 [Sulfitobacter sp. D35]|uniref:hypothetical protein n=1 Tax=Sulfitobacter sp. D35 TaxID=3083252 RepID=UPI00296FFD9B|nr:hypothetical protein [Sulfitobacter sp. D35]MDW4499583.1 hypothetical protein [Sulfitobacter sp. D35]